MSPPRTESPAKSHFSRDVITLVTGTTAGLIITLLASPLITRLYGPEAFGLVALFTSITGICGIVVCLRYEQAILLPESDEEAANVVGLCLIAGILISLLSIPVVILVQEPVVQFLKAPQLAPFLWLIPLTLFLIAISSVLNYWNTRMKGFRRLSVARVTGSVSTTGTQLGLGYLGQATGGVLIGAYILGQIVPAGVLAILIVKDHLSFFRQHITRKGMAEVLGRYSNFPKFDLWSNVLNSISWQVPIFLLAYFFSTTIVGYYSLGMMLIQLPMGLIGSAIAQVFFQRAAEANTEGKLGSLVEEVFKTLVKIGIFPMTVLLFIGSDLFIVFFGPQWATAGTFVQILSVWAFVWFISSPLSSLISVLEIQSWGLNLNIVIFLTRIVPLVIGGMMGNVYLALLLFSISGIFVYGYLCVQALLFSGVPLSVIKNELVSSIPKIAIPGFIFILLGFLSIDARIVIAVACCAGLIYYIWIVKDDPTLQNMINQVIFKK
jgi:O-antigen/teichoic acid export membrane protein